MFPTFQLGPLAIQAAGLFVLASIWIGMTLTEKRAAAHGLKSDSLDSLILLALAGFVFGGRLAYAAIHLDNLRASPLDIFSLDRALFDMPGGLAASLVTGLVYGQRKGLPFWPTLDALTPFFATLMIGIGAAHLAGGEAFGRETSLPWGIELHGAVRHPSQVYEVAAALFILRLVGLRKPFPTTGVQFLGFVAWTAGASLFLEAFRGDSILLFGGIRLGQVVAWIVLAAALFGMERLQEISRTGNPTCENG
jgi:phosphatidylglycerol:prolipoprotein diacylglycerol transferase